MEKIRLSKRLAAIAALIPKGSLPVDVGTDHGLLPAWLIQNGVCEKAIATDINRGPLEAAAHTARSAGTEKATSFFLCDGLAGCGENSADAIVIAGMGGETMISILSAAPWTKNGARLILQPQSRQEKLRRWLLENGYRIDSEALVEDGKLYQLLTATGGADSRRYTEAEYHLGAYELASKSPLFFRYLCAEISKLQKAIAGQESAERPDAGCLSAQRALLEEYLNMKARSQL